MSNLRGAIMNLSAPEPAMNIDRRFAYRKGYFDAACAAAELALEVDYINAELLATLREAEAMLAEKVRIFGADPDLSVIYMRIGVAIRKAGG